MGTLIELAVIGALIAGVMFGLHKAWDGFKQSVAAPYVEAQIKADQPKIDEAEAAQKAAESDRDTARANFDGLKQSCDAQSVQIDAWKKIAGENAAKATKAKQQADKEAAAAAPYIASLQAKAAAAPQLESCQVELAKAKDTLREAIRQRRTPPAPPPK